MKKGAQGGASRRQWQAGLVAAQIVGTLFGTFGFSYSTWQNKLLFHMAICANCGKVFVSKEGGICASCEAAKPMHGSSTPVGASQGVLICSCILLAAFFMPWFGLEGIGLSGFQLAKLGSHEFGSDVGPVWLIWLIPLMAGITLLVSIQRMNNRVWGFFTGWTPVVVLGYAFIKITGNDGERGMRNAFEFFRHALAIGSYLTLGTGIAIIIASAQSAPSNPPESRPSSSSQNKLSELERLARLRDSGVLTQEEFEAQKKLLLG